MKKKVLKKKLKAQKKRSAKLKKRLETAREELNRTQVQKAVLGRQLQEMTHRYCCTYCGQMVARKTVKPVRTFLRLGKSDAEAPKVGECKRCGTEVPVTLRRM